MRSRTAGPRRFSIPRRFLPPLVAALAVGAILVGCFVVRSRSEPVPGVGVGAVLATPSPQEISVGAAQYHPSTPSVGPGATSPVRPMSPVPPATSSSTAGQPLVSLDVPEPGQSVYSPAYVRGRGVVPVERTLEVQVLSVDGEILGRGPILFDPGTHFGEEAVFEGTLPFRQPTEQQLGSVRVLVQSLRDDSVVDYAQVLVVLLPAGSGSTEITIDAPLAGTVIGNPVRVEGIALAPQNQVAVRLKSGPAVLAAVTVPLAGEIGEPGQFSVDLSYAPFPASAGSRPGYPAPSENARGYIEVFYRSPKDGRIAAISSIPVVISLPQDSDH